MLIAEVDNVGPRSQMDWIVVGIGAIGDDVGVGCVGYGGGMSVMIALMGNVSTMVDFSHQKPFVG